MASQTSISQATASSSKQAGPRKGIHRRAAPVLSSTTSASGGVNPFQRDKTPSAQSKRPIASFSKACCGNPKIVTDDENGGRVCENCGAVVEGRQLVNDVGFTETSTGAPVATGTRVGQFATHAAGSFDRRGFRRGDEAIDSAEQTTQRAKKIITKLANSVRINEVIQDEAVQVFRLCGPGNFLQGRTTTSVAAVCLYIACRRNPLDNAVLLIDLAEKTNTNVFKLGKLYTKIVDAMRFNEDLINKNNNQKIHIPQYAPESLIQRFVNELEFDRERTRVMEDAVKVFKRMKRDWIAEGRRPAGICAAAVILGARMNNFRRTVREVVYVAKVCEMTINKRLDEFKVTDTGKMTVDEFRDVDIEAGTAHDPPAFTRGKEPKKPKKRDRKRKRPEGETAAEIEGDDTDTLIDNHRPTKKRKGRVDSDGFAIPDLPVDPTLGNSPIQRENEPMSDTGNTTEDGNRSDVNNSTRTGTFDTSSLSTDSIAVPESPREGPRKRGRPKGSKNRKMPPPTPTEAALEAEIETDVHQMLERHQSSDTTEPTNPTATDSDLEESEEEPRHVWPMVKDVPMDPDIDPNEFDDDPEVANCLLDEEESRAKEMIWVTENKDWLYKHLHKEFFRKKRELEGKSTNRDPSKRRRPRGDVSYITRDKEDEGLREGETEEQANKRRALDAQIAMLKHRGTFSQAVDYSALADMGYDVRSHTGGTSGPSSSDRSRSGSRSIPTTRPLTPTLLGSSAQNGSLTQRLNHAAMRLRQSMSPSPHLNQTNRGSTSPSPQLDLRRQASAAASAQHSLRTNYSLSPSASPVPSRPHRDQNTSTLPSSAPTASRPPAANDTPTINRSTESPRPQIRNIEEEIVGEIVPIGDDERDLDDEEAYGDDDFIEPAGDEEDIIESAFSGQYRATDSNGEDEGDDDDYID